MKICKTAIALSYKVPNLVIPASKTRYFTLNLESTTDIDNISSSFSDKNYDNKANKTKTEM